MAIPYRELSRWEQGNNKVDYGDQLVSVPHRNFPSDPANQKHVIGLDLCGHSRISVLLATVIFSFFLYW